jgi:Holliday junction resolvase RusA-like endonuclease
VTAEAARATEAAGLANPAYGRDPVGVSFDFRFPRPRSHYGKRGLLPSAPRHMVTKPDLDKLIRAALDALTGIIWRDDAQVVRFGEPSKDYVAEGGELVTTIVVWVVP